MSMSSSKVCPSIRTVVAGSGSKSGRIIDTHRDLRCLAPPRRCAASARRVGHQVTPALRFETFLETFFGLAVDGKTNEKGLPNPLQLAVLMRAYRDEVRLARPSPAVQALLFGPLAVLGRSIGYRSSYPR